MGRNEEDLSANLIDPELPPVGDEFTKGELQPTRCNDAWAAVLFYGNVIAIAAVAGALGVPAIQSYNNSNDHSFGKEVVDGGNSNIDYEGIIYGAWGRAEKPGIFGYEIRGGDRPNLDPGVGCIFGRDANSFPCPKILIQISVLFSLVLSGLMAAVSFFYGQIWGGIFGIIFFLLSLCYTYYVWRRIPFAAANLNTGLTAVKANSGVVVMSYVLVAASFCYMILWMVALVGVYDKLNLITTDAQGNVQVTGDQLNWGYFFLLLVALFWSEQVFQNTIHATIAGVVSTWWFVPEEANSCCSKGIWGSFIRSTTTSFGSICFGSLLVAIIKALRVMVESARSDSEGGCAAFLLCLVECLLRCLEGILEYFNKFAYIYVGMYGYSYLEAGKNVMTLFQQKGWTVIINDDLVSNVLFLFVLIIGGLTGCVGLVLNEINPLWFQGYGGSPMAIAFGFMFLVGLIIASITMSVVDSAVNTVIVAFAEGPAEFEENHPELSHQMKEGWRKVYPDECGF
ncbi:hypothetical protein THAOC_20618 [Thalassiosira oceanica]|uniref:Choline transporter-like protein n=1 Tax=Thalassiosira oceanica TaxID=159749 RepID=K0SE55_THAOC|nr:hypothetical protein THAOC_20618 [Thalassiosira oceanica]|eukprot:EJK59191.1 hypothetical protein THAOC_20618 [Thalassiosira oceanica]